MHPELCALRLAVQASEGEHAFRPAAAATDAAATLRLHAAAAQRARRTSRPTKRVTKRAAVSRQSAARPTKRPTKAPVARTQRTNYIPAWQLFKVRLHSMLLNCTPSLALLRCQTLCI